MATDCIIPNHRVALVVEELHLLLSLEIKAALSITLKPQVRDIDISEDEACNAINFGNSIK